ncbi:MAG: sulfatase [Candidatus Rokubacteria bacterium]|nr:sulfatase [Candidatus Rokubacteria bacterium]
MASAVHDHPAGLLQIAAWFALLTGLGEVSGLAVAKWLLQRYLHLSPYVVWMAPATDLALFALAGLGLWAVGRRWPALVSLRGAAFVFALLGCLSLLLMVTRLHAVAALLLAAGLATQASRVIAAYPRGFRLLRRRTTGALAALVVLLAAAVHGWPALAEQRALATLPRPPADAPNVLLIVLDTVRARNLSLYGYGRATTPRLEKFAKRGVLFDRAFATSPWTLPSHASMFTGRYPHEVSADWTRPLDATHPTLAELLSAHGYATAAFVANTIYCSWESGLDRGFARYEDYRVSPGQIVLGSSLARTVLGSAAGGKILRIARQHQRFGRKSAAQLNEDFLRWLPHTERRPFFVFLNYFDAHDPYLPPEPFATMFGPPRPARDPTLLPERRWTPPEMQAEMDAYDGAIAYLDHHLGRLLDGLEAAGVLASTLVIVTSDHGEEFGEHGTMGHGNSLYLPSLHVPLLIVLPSRVPGGRIVPEPVTLRDLPATVVDLLRLPGRRPFPGQSLARHWDGTGGGAAPDPALAEVNFAPGRPGWFPVSKGNMKSLLAGRDHYIRNGDGGEELYDVEADALEQRDRAASPEGLGLLGELRAQLETILRRAALPLLRARPALPGTPAGAAGAPPDGRGA